MISRVLKHSLSTFSKQRVIRRLGTETAFDNDSQQPPSEGQAARATQKEAFVI